MKKKFAIIFLTTLLTIATLFVFVACGEKPCEHNWSNATCTTAKTCTLCNETEGSALGHSLGEWNETLAATCTTDGSKNRQCSACQYTETQAITKLGHDDSGEWVITLSATCTADGSKHQICGTCREEINVTVIPAVGHTDGAWITDSDATCTVDGSKHQICSVCEDTIETEVIPATGHTPGQWITDEDATCEEDGEKHQICSVCEETIDTGIIPATGHTEGAWVTDSDATCTVDGSKHQICSVCEDTIETEVIPATGHTPGQWITDEDATCEEDGAKHQICSVCEETIDTGIIPATGHTEGAWVTDSDATCTVDGSKHQICSVCEDTIEIEAIPATGHDYKEELLKKDCTDDAKIIYTCESCGDTYEEKISYPTISTRSTGVSSMTSNGYGRYTHYFDININGGYGNISVIFELYKTTSANPHSTNIIDYRNISYNVSYTGYYSDISNYFIKLKIKDEADNIVVYTVDLATTITTNAEVIGECKQYNSFNDLTYINMHGFGKYQCKKCQKVCYQDKEGNILEVAKLVLNEAGTIVMNCENIDTAELLIIPETVTSFNDNGLFVYCDNLKYVLLNNNSVDIRLQGAPIEKIFVPVGAEASLCYCDNLKTVIWQDGITTVDQYKTWATTGCNLGYSSIENIVIPTSVTKIYRDVFMQCLQLTSVFYMGTADDWDNITIDETGNAYLTEATRYYYSEEAPVVEGNYWHYVDGVPTVWDLEE